MCFQVEYRLMGILKIGDLCYKTDNYSHRYINEQVAITRGHTIHSLENYYSFSGQILFLFITESLILSN